VIQPETRYTIVGEDRIAYQMLGEGPRDILHTTGFWSHLDIEWEDPSMARFFRHLASFSRLIRFDRRGTGLSDRASDASSSDVERWLQDCAAVLDAVGSTAAIIVGMRTIEVGALALHFADRHPDRVSGLVLIDATACWAVKPDYPEGLSPEAIREYKEFTLRTFGTLEYAIRFAPTQAKNESVIRWLAKLQRSMAPPRAVVENMDTWTQLDCRALLPRIRVPTLVLARGRRMYLPIQQTRYLAEHIPGARFVEVKESGASPGRKTGELELIEEFVTGVRHGGEVERALLTIMFTDIAGSTQRAAELGDSAWRQLLERHDRVVREQIATHRGRFIESSGDGTLTTFDRPGFAIDCARALQQSLTSLGIEIRVGLHTGEAELREEGRIGGMAVHIGARVMAEAKAGEVLVSHTVHGILAGSPYRFTDRGTHSLKGVPGEWRLFSLEGPSQ
jgi:class 3 adenylate cyclase/pimeloyl-ACP methyl ester carboxylesterase